MSPAERLRVAFVAGTLERGGAEKQLRYMARSLRDEGADVRVLALDPAGPVAAALEASGLPPEAVGGWGLPATRLPRLVAALRGFRPHVVQASHFYVNLYAAISARALGAIDIGALRGEAERAVRQNKGWGRWLLRAPRGLVCNSEGARAGAVRLGRRTERTFLLPNAIDLEEFDAGTRSDVAPLPRPAAIVIGRLIPEKRVDRFLRALARARADAPELTGVVVGDGPERPALERLARSLGLSPAGVLFLGDRSDVSDLLRGADVLVLSSDSEGFPNVLLEAMAARTPVVTTPAGESPRVVLDGETGWVVPFQDEVSMASRLVEAVRDPAKARRLGESGRRRAQERFTPASLASGLLEIYARCERHD